MQESVVPDDQTDLESALEELCVAVTADGQLGGKYLRRGPQGALKELYITYYVSIILNSLYISY